MSKLALYEKDMIVNGIRMGKTIPQLKTWIDNTRKLLDTFEDDGVTISEITSIYAYHGDIPDQKHLFDEYIEDQGDDYLDWYLIEHPEQFETIEDLRDYIDECFIQSEIADPYNGFGFEHYTGIEPRGADL